MTYIAIWASGIALGVVLYWIVLYLRGALTPITFLAAFLAVMAQCYGSKLQYRLEHFPLGYAVVFPPLEVFAPGLRIPMGVFLGGLIPILFCMALRAPWRLVGDGLALGGAAMVAVGRFACWVNGCCMGTVCGRWALPFCVTTPPGSEAYNAQLRDHLIQLAATRSLPVHPLPLYFAAGGLGIFCVMIWMFRRQTAPGMMLVVGSTLAAAGKLALETLRAEPRPPGIMFELPETVLAIGLLTLLVILVRRLASRPATLAAAEVKGLLAGTIALTLGLAGAHAAAADDAPAVVVTRHVPTAGQALSSYAQNPLKNRRGLRQLEHDGTDTLPPVVLLAMGDARLRSGQRRQAARLFSEVIDREPGEPFESWARLGLGWNALMAGDVDSARPYFADIADSGSNTSGMARLLVALIDASDGKDVGVEVFDKIAADETATPSLRAVARLSGGYARYWRGDYQGAVSVLEDAAASASSGQLVDDLQYAAAWARVRGGDRERGEAALRALAGDGKSKGIAPVSKDLMNLDQRALLRAYFERYRRGPLVAPEARMADLLDGDGTAMARAALRHIDEAPQMGASAPLRRALAVSDAPESVGSRSHGSGASSRAAGHASGAASAAHGAAQRSADHGRVTMYLVAAVLLVIGLVFATWRRPYRPGPRSCGGAE